MRKLGLRTIVIYGLACLSGIVLLYTSQAVQKAEDRLGAIESSAQGEAEAIRVLRAEWAYLNNPERLETLAQEFLSLDKPDPSRIVTEPSLIPDVQRMEQDEVLYREINAAPDAVSEFAPDGEGAPSDALDEAPVIPAKKPDVPKRKSEKSFDKLLGELSEGGAQ